MDVEHLFRDFQPDDLQWFIPIAAGMLVIVGALLVAIIRGMTSGVIVAIIFGGLLSMSPIILETLERDGRIGSRGAEPSVAPGVARGAAELAALNNEAITELNRVVTSMRTTLAGVDADLFAGDDPTATQRYTSGLADAEQQLEAAVAALERTEAVRDALADDVATLEGELERAAER